jgi:hypothetical protein
MRQWSHCHRLPAVSDRGVDLRSRASCPALLACVLAWASRAHAQTDEIQVYDAEIAAPGQFELTWHNLDSSMRPRR